VRPLVSLAAAALLAACSDNNGASDIPPLPPETADTANQLMAEAERAAANAQGRVEPKAAPAGSAPTSNEVTR
jgi:hypothetical protein